MVKGMLLKLIGEESAGRLDYLLNRKSKNDWGPLNGQKLRQEAYAAITKRISFRAIVETGTFLGTTTDYFGKAGLPVYTVEIDPRAFGYAAQRFAKISGRIHVVRGNSPDFLTGLIKDQTCPKERVFFYLDAHVQDSSGYFKAPLAEELEIIFSNWKEPVVMIDDFQVPGTTYSFDDWGDPRKNLCLEALAGLKPLQLTPFFPASGPEQETGAKRGWVVFAREPAILRELESLKELRRQAVLGSA